jgi:hypothetical protein
MIYLNYLGKMGQLGNQMFQYAALRGIANHNGYDYAIPNHNELIVDALGNKLRIELFGPFKLKNFSDKNIGSCDSNAQIVQEKQFNFDEDIFNSCPDNSCLVGYFQTEKYFSHIREELLEDFEFIDDIQNPCKEMIQNVKDPIALHIRRGDFLRNSGNHHNLSLDYYEKALSHYDSNREVIIFSDEPQWCKEQSLFSDDRFLISESENSYADLCLMSMCSDFIIANSTFSWWGAWLSQNKNKTVLYPSKWFGPNNTDKSTEDLFPKEWGMVK